MKHLYSALRRLLALAVLPLSTLSGANLYLSNVQGLLGYESAYQGQFLFNAPSATFGGMYGAGSPSLYQEWNATANVSNGTLRVRSLADNTGGDALFDQALTSVIAAIADTFTYAGPVAGTDQITAQIDLTGTWAASTTGPGTIVNQSYLRIYFLQPGSLDAPSILASANIIAQAIWGVGPDAEASPFLADPVTYSGYLSSFPATVTIPINVASLPSGFQVLVLLQTQISGATNGIGGSVSWAADLGNTAHFSLIAPDTLGLTSAGGSPITPTSAVPEPATWGLMIAGAGIAAWRRSRP